MKSQGINNSMFTNPLQKEEDHFGTYPEISVAADN